MGAGMDALTIELRPDELASLNALAAANGGDPDGVARELLRSALAAKLDEAGRPSATDAGRAPVSRTQRMKTIAFAVVGAVVAIVLWGGYVQEWSWTGFPDNKQLWDWLNLLLLPIVFATIPLWLRRSSGISRSHRLMFGGLVVAFAVFVAVGYLVPLHWTGFSGNRLWDWLVLILLPVTLVTLTSWSTSGRTITQRHKVIAAVLAAAWFVTVLGGYEWGWNWTGYQGNTLWDWLQLVLLPLVVPTLLAPAALAFVAREPTRRPAVERNADGIAA
jgi:hypothetical protein